MDKNIIDWETFECITKLGDCKLSREMFETHASIMFHSGTLSETRSRAKEIQEKNK